MIGRVGGTVPTVILSPSQPLRAGSAKDRVGATLGLRMTLVALGFAAACSRPPIEPAPLHVTTTSSGPDTRLTLHAEPGLKINARLAPALELPDGTVLRFDAAERTADSAYFAVPPAARLAGRHAEVHGTLRASVCREDELVCRSVTLEL